LDVIIVQNSQVSMFQKLADALPESVEVVIVDDINLPESLDKHKSDVKAIVLFQLTDSASRFCELVRNGRYCHPWAPIAIISESSPEPGPIGSNHFYTAEDDSLIDYLSKPVSKSILVIEDDEKIRYYLSMCLGSQYHVETASNAQEGEQLYIDGDFDLIILDVMLPGMNGDELIQKIRLTDTDTPILVITAYDSSSREAEFNAYGATDYMTKPFKGNDVVRARVMSVLSADYLRKHHEADSTGTLNADQAWAMYATEMDRFVD